MFKILTKKKYKKLEQDAEMRVIRNVDNMLNNELKTITRKRQLAKDSQLFTGEYDAYKVVRTYIGCTPDLHKTGATDMRGNSNQKLRRQQHELKEQE